MSVWDSFEARVEAAGKTKRERALNSTQMYMRYKTQHSLSSKIVSINGTEQRVTIINQEEWDQRKIIALPGDTIPHGGIVDFADNKWLIIKKDPDAEICESGLMKQCNYLLKWRDRQTGEIIEKWSIVEDGTKYLIGEQDEDIISVGASRFALTLAKDSDTVKLERGMRFLIYDPECSDVLAYELSKPNTFYNVYNEEGVYRFILREDQVTKDDNRELMVADYYNWDVEDERDDIDDGTQEGVWL